MNTDTGMVMTDEARRLLKESAQEEFTAKMKRIDPAYLTSRARAELAAKGQTRVFKNSPCPCGSRKRFKNCCRTSKA